MHTPADKAITFVFASHPVRNKQWCWTARLAFAPGSGPDSVLPITLTDGEGTPIEKGSFEFAGRKLKIVAGETSIRYADFIQGKHEVELWVRRPGLPPVPGGLTFQ